MSDEEIDYVINALILTAKQGWKLLPYVCITTDNAKLLSILQTFVTRYRINKFNTSLTNYSIHLIRKRVNGDISRFRLFNFNLLSTL